MSFEKLGGHDLSTGGLVLVGVVVLFFVFRVGKLVQRLGFLLVAAALFAAAYWWHTQR